LNKSTKISKNNFKVIQAQNYQGFSFAAFQETLKLTKGSRQKLLVLPTGNTPTGFYQQFTDYLLKNSKEKHRFFFTNLDEYLGIPQNSKVSFQSYLKRNISNKLKLPNRYFYWINNKTPIEKEKRKVESIIKKFKKIDLCILGLGKNGHIAFNEPGCDWDLEFFDTPLDKVTKNDLRNLSIPITHGRTLGIKKILSAKKILLLVSGKKKKIPLQKLLKKKVDQSFPVTSLINHPNLTIIIQK
jgi:6-phosphogluconolactonase/glucosamine-6-phosphate isomerase/deaminase